MNMIQDNLLSKPKHIVSLASSCVLVSVESHVWNATVQDKQISDEVTAAKKADKDAGKFVKNLLAKNTEHKAVLNYRQTIYNWVQRNTYDWAGSQRLLPITNLVRFHKEYTEHEKRIARGRADLLGESLASAKVIRRAQEHRPELAGGFRGARQRDHDRRHLATAPTKRLRQGHTGFDFRCEPRHERSKLRANTLLRGTREGLTDRNPRLRHCSQVATQRREITPPRTRCTRGASLRRAPRESRIAIDREHRLSL
jgi:hypothetical protein